MPKNICPALNNESESDDDDVDLFVSPRHFVGRTPGPKATKQKIFEEKSSSTTHETTPQPRTLQSNLAFGIENVKYMINTDDSDKELTHTSVRRNTILSWVCLVANYILVVASVYLLALSIWAIISQRNSGLTSFMAVEGIGLRSPLGFGLCLMLASILGIINALVLGVQHIIPSIVEGFHTDTRRKAFLLHQIMSVITLLLLILVLMSSVPPLSLISSSGVSVSTWTSMATKYPQSVCSFQVKKKCAGPINYACMTSQFKASSISCPGHYCSEVCKVGARRPISQMRASCMNCLPLMTSPMLSLLSRCRETELNRASSRNCREPLTKVIRRFYTVFIVSTGVVIGISMLVIMCSVITPLLTK